MNETTTREAFTALLRGVAAELHGIDLRAADAAARVDARVPFGGEAVRQLRAAAFAAVDSPWLLPKANAGIRFGRVAKDLAGFSVDAVLMDRPGPRHRHPNGEVDLCLARAGAPRFDGHAEGWVVYGPGSVHVPTVTGGEMLILYFLPGGAIEFLKE
jgi:hypothetical protein